jgi:ferritin-like metal-binding protein YciE
MASILTLHALLVDELRDLFHAEQQLVRALPKMERAASDPSLKAAFAEHVFRTHGHVDRLARSLRLLDAPIEGKTCRAMLGLVAEAGAAVVSRGPAVVRDARLIGAAQRVEHYEIAGYGTARAFAEALGETAVVDLLQATLEEEGDANLTLTELSATVNFAALYADTDTAIA